MRRPPGFRAAFCVRRRTATYCDVFPFFLVRIHSAFRKLFENLFQNSNFLCYNKGMVNGEIAAIAKKFKESLNPLRIYLFGSYARGDFNEKSDYDFYIIVPDENYDNIEQTNTAYCSLIGMKRKPVDIVIGNASLFERRKNINSIEKIVAKEGVVLYER